MYRVARTYIRVCTVYLLPITTVPLYHCTSTCIYGDYYSCSINYYMYTYVAVCSYM